MRIIPRLARVQTNVYYKKASPGQNLMSKDTEDMDTGRKALKASKRQKETKRKRGGNLCGTLKVSKL